MNPLTGAIAKFETDEDAKAAGYTVPLTKADAAALLTMNRAERRDAQFRPGKVADKRRQRKRW